MNKPVIIFGASGLAKAALEIFNSNSIVVYGFLDDDEATHNNEIDGVSVLGSTDDHGFLKLIGQKCEAFVATDDNKLREQYVGFLNDSRKVMPVNAIHELSSIANSSSIGHGNFINAGAIIGNHVKVGQHNVINTGVLIEQETTIEDFVQIGTGSIVNANVKIEKGAFIGSGVTIVSGVTIGKKARIGAGSVVVGNVEANQTVFGNPAVEVKS